MLHAFLLFRIHVHGLFFIYLFYHLLLFKCHIVSRVPRVPLLHCLIVRQHILLNHGINFLRAAYLQLLLKVLGHVAHLLFHLIHQVRLPLQVHLFVGDQFIQQVSEQLTSHVQSSGCVFQGLRVEEGEGVSERKT